MEMQINHKNVEDLTRMKKGFSFLGGGRLYDYYYSASPRLQFSFSNL